MKAENRTRLVATASDAVSNVTEEDVAIESKFERGFSIERDDF